jgi:very-short-patch-repair endonuclease
MGTQSPTRVVDRAIAELAGRQHGVVARSQLLERAVTPDQIKLRLRNGRLHQVHRGIYLVGHDVPTRHARDMAALLASGSGAVLSHRSAADLWQLLPYPADARACVTVPRGRTTRRPRIEAHRATVPRSDIRRRSGMWLTSPPRTIIDLASRLGPNLLERVVAEAQYRRLATESELSDLLRRHTGKRGIGVVRTILDRPGGARRTRSPAERQMLHLLRRTGVTGYETNARIHGYEVDLLWRELGVVVEIDGYDAHSGRIAFERDRLKVATLTANGLRVVPFTGRQIRDAPQSVIRTLFQAFDWGS